MTVAVQEADIGHVTAVGTVLMAGSLQRQTQTHLQEEKHLDVLFKLHNNSRFKDSRIQDKSDTIGRFSAFRFISYGVCVCVSHLSGGAWVGEQVNFTEVVSQSDHLSVVRSDQCVDVGAVRALRPHT